MIILTSNNFIILLASILGLVGSIFLAKGNIFLNSKKILHLTTPHSYIYWAPEQEKAFATIRNDSIIGFINIFLSFFICVINSIYEIKFENDLIQLDYIIVILCFIVYIYILLLVSFFLNFKLIVDIQKEGVKDIFDGLFKNTNSIKYSEDRNKIERIIHAFEARKMIVIPRNDKESDLDYFKRILDLIDPKILNIFKLSE